MNNDNHNGNERTMETLTTSQNDVFTKEERCQLWSQESAQRHHSRQDKIEDIKSRQVCVSMIELGFCTNEKICTLKHEVIPPDVFDFYAVLKAPDYKRLPGKTRFGVSKQSLLLFLFFMNVINFLITAKPFILE